LMLFLFFQSIPFSHHYSRLKQNCY
jgi:hypothetical protein